MSRKTRLERLERKVGKPGGLDGALIEISLGGGRWYDKPGNDPDRRELTQREMEEVAAGVDRFKVKTYGQ